MLWEAPRMEKLSLMDRFRLEKFRKWGVDSLPWADFKEFWPDFARYLGHQYYDPGNKPVFLSLCLYWSDIPPPESASNSRSKLPEHTKFTTQFTYRYVPEDFK
jgi:hypothetical protein